MCLAVHMKETDDWWYQGKLSDLNAPAEHCQQQQPEQMQETPQRLEQHPSTHGTTTSITKQHSKKKQPKYSNEANPVAYALGTQILEAYYNKV